MQQRKVTKALGENENWFKERSGEAKIILLKKIARAGERVTGKLVRSGMNIIKNWPKYTHASRRRERSS
jgi:hypothetical protein